MVASTYAAHLACASTGYARRPARPKPCPLTLIRAAPTNSCPNAISINSCSRSKPSLEILRYSVICTPGLSSPHHCSAHGGRQLPHHHTTAAPTEGINYPTTIVPAATLLPMEGKTPVRVSPGHRGDQCHGAIWPRTPRRSVPWCYLAQDTEAISASPLHPWYYLAQVCVLGLTPPPTRCVCLG